MIKTKQDNDVTDRKLNYKDISNWVRSMMKTRWENDVTHCISVVYTENKTELL